jgi:site-specific DNA-methyltransferase (adenine-specific)
MSESITYNTDCLEYMKTLPDKAFELAIVDPPYGIGAAKMTMGSGRHSFVKGKDWDNGIPKADYFEQLFRVSINQIIWGGNYFTEHLPPSKNWIVWDKQNPNLSFAEGELAWVREGKLLRIFQHYSAQVEEGGKIHPTQKPVALYEWLLKHYAKPGDKILDTHLGSGSSRIAAYNLGFDFVGCEIDPDYFAAEEKRFAAHIAQTSLFDKEAT